MAVARAAAFADKFVVMDEPTAALGVKESRRVLDLIQDVRARGMPIGLISHTMPHVFEVADRMHIHRLGRRLCVVDPNEISMSDAGADDRCHGPAGGGARLTAATAKAAPTVPTVSTVGLHPVPYNIRACSNPGLFETRDELLGSNNK